MGPNYHAPGIGRRIFGPQWESRKFRSVVYDMTLSLVLFFVGYITSPQLHEACLVLIGIIQPVFAAQILGIAYEDGQAKSAPKQVQSVNVEASDGDNQ